MAQKRIKRTDQEWFDLIRDCKTSSLKVKIWCEQHGITAKTIDYHARRLRQKGYRIPKRITKTIPYEKQEVVCLEIPQSTPAGMAEGAPFSPRTSETAVLWLEFQGVHIEISNGAAQETITNTLLALRNLC